MVSQYPSQIDSSFTLGSPILTAPNGQVLANTIGALINVETTLGENPQGIFSSVRVRLDSMQGAIIALEESSGGGSGNVVVVGQPQIGNAIVWDGANYIPSNNFLTQPITLSGITQPSLSAAGTGVIYFDSTSNEFFISQNGSAYQPIGSGGGSFTPGGDLSGTSTSQTVVGLYNHPVSSTSPSTYYALLYSGTSWTPTKLTDDPEIIGPAFAITLSGGSLQEVSSTLSSPSFTGTENYTATAATLTNNANAESVNVLTQLNNSTSFSSSRNYTQTSYGGSVIFTLTASRLSGAIVRTGTTTFTWVQRVYWGVGPAGQSSASFITSTLGGQNNPLATSRSRTFTVSAGTNQKIYYAYRAAYGNATFTVGGFAGGFSTQSTVSITNNYGFTENYYLYESDNLDLGSVSVVVS